MAVNWNLGVMPDVGQNALAAFKTGQQERKQENAQNALAQYAVNPDDPKAFQALAQANPQLAIQERQRMEERLKAKTKQELIAKAGQGDKTAILGLWGVDPGMAMKLDDRQKDFILEGMKFVSGAAYDIAQRPEHERPALWDQYIEQGVAAGHTELAQHRGKYSPGALNAIVAQAGEMKSFMEFQQPKYIAPGEGGLRGFQFGQPIRDASGQPAQFSGDVPPPPPGFKMDTPAAGGGGGNVTSGFLDGLELQPGQ